MLDRIDLTLDRVLLIVVSVFAAVCGAGKLTRTTGTIWPDLISRLSLRPGEQPPRIEWLLRFLGRASDHADSARSRLGERRENSSREVEGALHELVTLSLKETNNIGPKAREEQL
jgi:hypothetical protein